MIEAGDIRARYRQAAKFLDERGRRLCAANEALAIGYGGVTAASAATGLARSTIRRAIVELQGGSNPIGSRVRRPGGGRKRAVVLQPGLPARSMWMTFGRDIGWLSRFWTSEDAGCLRRMKPWRSAMAA